MHRRERKKNDVFFVVEIVVWLCASGLIRTREGDKKGRRQSWLNAVILIKPLDGVTAGHPQPSAACFPSKQACFITLACI